MIDGLKLTMTGQEIRDKIEERIRTYETRLASYEEELGATGQDVVETPEHVLETKIEESRDQIGALKMIRDHVVANEVYRLGEYDLRFADLLPDRFFT